MPNKNGNSTPYQRIINTPSILNLLLIMCIIASLAIGSVYLVFYEYDGTVLSLVVLGLVSSFLLILQKRGYYQAVGVSLSALVSIVLTYNISIGNAIYDEAMLAYPLIMVFTGLLFGKRSVTLITGLTLAQIVLVYILALNGLVRPFDGRVPFKFEELITTLIILLATGMILWVVVNLIENTVQKIIKSETEIQNSYDLTLEAWAKALELRGREVSGHSRRVTELSVKLANRLGFNRDEVIQLWRGALLHDIGKMGVPENILLKPGPLTEEELEIIWKHPLMGREIFKDIPYLDEALKVVAYHHEQVDGMGYPDQLLHKDIPLTARVFSVVDNWDMLRSDRPFGKGWSKEDTIAYLQAEAGIKFDPMVVRELLALVEGEEDNG